MPQCRAIASSTKELVRLLGGTGAVAQQVGLKPPAVSAWQKRGDVPPAYHTAILALAVQNSILWRPPGWPPQLELRWHDPAPVAQTLNLAA